jgi:hypothetical protein
MTHDGAYESWRDDGRPWDEYEWEAFLQEQDELTERYMELEARYRDLPDAEDRIAREMGWELPAAFSRDAEPSDYDDDGFDGLDEAEPCSYEEDPLWRRAHDVAVRLHRALPVPADGAEAPAVPELLTQVAMIAAKVAGGRSMGFSRDALGGNIANHKRAMQHVLLSLAGVDRAERAGAIARGPAGCFRRDLLGVRERLMHRIVELRQMFHSGQFIDD